MTEKKKKYALAFKYNKKSEGNDADDYKAMVKIMSPSLDEFCSQSNMFELMTNVCLYLMIFESRMSQLTYET
jgi:hypothetical protein